MKPLVVVIALFSVAAWAEPGGPCEINLVEAEVLAFETRLAFTRAERLQVDKSIAAIINEQPALLDLVRSGRLEAYPQARLDEVAIQWNSLLWVYDWLERCDVRITKNRLNACRALIRELTEEATRIEARLRLRGKQFRINRLEELCDLASGTLSGAR